MLARVLKMGSKANASSKFDSFSRQFFLGPIKASRAERYSLKYFEVGSRKLEYGSGRLASLHPDLSGFSVLAMTISK